MDVMNLKIKDIHADDTFNCREKLIPLDVVELSNSIKTLGLLQPVIVRKATPADKIAEPWVLLAGFRRRFASMVAGLDTIHAIETGVRDRKEALLVNISENLNRKDLNIVEEGHVFNKLIAEGMGQKEIAESIGKSLAYVVTRVRLCALPDDIKKEAAAKTLTQYHINKILQFPNGSDKQYAIVRQIKEQLGRGMRKTEIEVKKLNTDYSKQKKRRSHIEVGRMKWFLLNNNLDGLPARLLAWCEGNITNEEVFKDIDTYAKDLGKAIQIPKNHDLTA